MKTDIFSVYTPPRQVGAGIPLVLLHAVGLDLTWWRDQIGALSNNRAVWALDLPGHGRSGDTSDYNIATLSDEIAAFIGSEIATRCVVCGLSVGGMIAQQIAIRHPSLIERLILINTASRFSQNAQNLMIERANSVAANGMQHLVQPTIERWFNADFRKHRPDIVESCRRHLSQIDPETHGRMWRAIARHNTYSDIVKLQQPTLVLVGEDDTSTTPSMAREIADAIPHAQLRVLSGASHLSPIETPNAVNNEIREFLASSTTE